MLCLERLLRDEADQAKLAERRCRMLRIRKEKLYGVARGIGELRGDARNLIERWKLQCDRIAPGAMVGNRVGAPRPKWRRLGEPICVPRGEPTLVLPEVLEPIRCQLRRRSGYWKCRTASIIFPALYGFGTNKLPGGISSP